MNKERPIKAVQNVIAVNLGKKAAELGVKTSIDAAISGTSLVYEFGKLGFTAAWEWYKTNREERVQLFHASLIGAHNEFAEAIAAAEIETADFNALFAACIADIEDEKTLRYAALARSIALRQVGADEKRFFILSLKELANADVERLRRSYIATRHELIPASGSMYDSGVSRGKLGTYRNFWL